MPCTSTKDMPWSPLPPYELVRSYRDVSNFTTSIDWDSNTAYDAQK